MNKNFFKFSRKNFFLNYLKKKGMIKVKVENIETQPLDLKDLLNDNKIRITFSDIFVDWINFRRSYYWYKVKREEVAETKVPFDKKEMNIKKFLQQIFSENYFRKSWKYFLYAILLVSYIVYRMDGAEKRNVEYLKRIGNTSNAEHKDERDKYKNFKF
jgi:hypothetical protein